MSAPDNCIDCPSHRVIGDRDPDDWFCDDDVAVVCSLTPNDKRNAESRHPADWSEHKSVTVGCRPFKVRNESARPSWCPLMIQAAA